MVAYSFKPSFVAEIIAKRKRQTIRLPRKRHARPGEALQLFTGPRMKPVRVGAATCRAVLDVRLDFSAERVELSNAIVIEGDAALNDFALRDGFSPRAGLEIAPWEYMARWWAMTHRNKPIFAGVLIDWDDTFQPPHEERR